MIANEAKNLKSIMIFFFARGGSRAVIFYCGYVHVASAFPLAHYHRAVPTWIHSPMPCQKSRNQGFFLRREIEKKLAHVFIPLYS